MRALIVVLFVLAFDFAYCSTVDSFLNRIEKVKTLEICFTQKSKLDPIQDEYDYYEGKLIIKKPLKFKWYYTRNSRAMVVSDGKFIYAYFPEQKQLNVSKVDNSTEVFPLISLISERLNFQKFYKKEALKVEGGFTEVIFKPRFKSSIFKSISIVYDNKKVIPIKVVTFGIDGSENIYQITCWKENVKIDDSTFEIKPSKGTLINSY